MKPYFTVPATLFAAAVAWSPAAQAQNQDLKALSEDLISRYESAFNNGSAGDVAALYAEDAVSMPPRMERAEGRETIKAQFVAMFEQMGLSGLEVSGVEAEPIDGDMAYQTGTYTMKGWGPEGEMTLAGDYMTLIEQNADGDWVIVRHIWNMDMPRQ